MNQPLWRAQARAPNRGNPPASVDVLVVGAGLAGLACAYRVLERDSAASVLVLDAAPLGSGASGRTTGMVTPGIGQDFAALVARVGIERAASLYAETREAVDDVGRLVAAERIDCGYRKVGQLVVAHGARGAQRLERQARALDAAGQPFAVLDGASLASRVRLENARDEGALAALFLPDAAIVDPLALLHGIANAIEARGAMIRTDSRVVAVSDGARPSVRLDSGETIGAGRVVLATAAESPRLAGLAGRVIPVRLQVLATAPLPPRRLAALRWAGRECIVDSRRLFNYFRLTADDRIVFGGGAPAYGFGPRDDYGELERELRATFPEPMEITHRWGGTIDYTLDGQPIVGPLRDGSRVFHAGGFCGHGIALGIRAGRWIAEAIAEAPQDRPLPRFRRNAPLVPGELLRRACFNLASSWMRLRGV